MTSAARPTKKAPEPTLYERWLRVRCPDKDCHGWTFVPENKLPDMLVCVLCRVRFAVKDLLKKGQEYRRR